MLTEAQLLSWILKGEDETLDFKREIKLGSAANKSEFIKDVLSIANSSDETGHIIIGVEDSGNIVGTPPLEEERIQQIAHMYINPPIRISCSMINLPSYGVNVGVIQIKGQEKPHKVTKTIDRLNQNEVFIRHGSVVTRASPEEIIRIHSDSKVTQHYQRYIEAANSFTNSGDFENGIDYYTKAIKLISSADVLILRGKSYEKWARKKNKEFKQHTKNMGWVPYLNTIEDERLRQSEDEILKSILESEKSLKKMALKDFSEAIIIADTTEIEKKARLLRLELLLYFNLRYMPDLWDEDFRWLETRTENNERAELLKLAIERIRGDEPYFEGFYDQAVSWLNEIIQLGFGTTEIYCFRAMAHSGAYNYGLALSDIKLALDMAKNPKDALPVYLEYAFTLSKMSDYKELFKLFQQIQSKYSKKEIGGYVQCTYNIVEEILFRCAIDLEFTELREPDITLGQQIVRFFEAWHTDFDEHFPEVAHIIHQIR